MTPEEQQKKAELEQQINSEFSQLQQNLGNLKKEVESETDEEKRQEKNKKIQEIQAELDEIGVGKERLERMTSLQEQELESLKTRLESLKTTVQNFRGEIVDLQSEKKPTPTTYELLKNSETYNRLLNIISSNPNKFKELKKDEEGNELDTPEKKLEYIFKKIRKSLTLFLKNKLGDSEKYNNVIDNTIAPAFEWSMMELLRDNGNENNISMLKGMNSISWKNFNKLIKSVGNFAKKATGSYNKFSQWINAVDYLSVHNGVLRNPNKSEVLTNPLKFQEYMNDSRFIAPGFSPYTAISGNIFKIDENQTFEFGVSLKEQKDEILTKIGNIQVVNNPKTTSLIVGLLDKPEKFLGATEGLQKTANSLLDGVDSLNSVTKMFGVDILGEITKSGEKSFVFKILDFVCKLIGITGGLEGIVKKWRLDRMDLTDPKNDNISSIFKEFKDRAGNNISISVTGPESCNSALNNFTVTDLNNQSITMGDHLRDSIAEKMDISLISPIVVQQAVEQKILSGRKEDYLKEEVDGNQNKKIVVNPEKFTSDDKKYLAHYHLINMKSHLEKYNENDLSDFYTNINSTEDLALCITASLYVNKEDVIEGVKAKVFLPENYGTVRLDGTVYDGGNIGGRENLDSTESSDKHIVSEQWVYDKAIEYGITDKRQIAYVLSTIKGEAPDPKGIGFKNQEEHGGSRQPYGKIDPTTKKAYYGRGFIQLTWKNNYQQYTQIIKDMGKDFKDNDGNIIKSSDIDLLNNPDLILKSNELAIFIAIHGMKNGKFTGKKLDDFINETKTDFYNARSIVNGMSSKPKEYADRAQAYLDKLGKGSLNSPTESNELLIGSRLLAKNKDEIGGLGNSIMNGFQGLDAKTNFPNMDGVVGKSTVTHPNRFNSQNDVLAYKNTHPNIKSFMFYFGVNTRDNNKTLSDIKQRSEWLQAEGIQPVLCTCIGEDKQTWLKELNQKLVSLGKEKNWPVLDFAKSYTKGDIALSGDGLHPKSYSPMANVINGVLQA